MSWPQRYCIPGAYTVISLTSFFYLVFGTPEFLYSGNITLIFTALLFISIPVAGYLLINLTSLLYNFFPPMRFYRELWQLTGKGASLMPAWRIEAEMTIKHFSLSEPNKVDKSILIRKWLRKRFDAILVNMSVIIATILILILANCLIIKSSFVWHAKLYLYLGIWYAASCLVVLVLIINSYVLSKQAREVAVKYCLDLLNPGGVTP